MKKTILLSGYYGFDNAGDEAILYSIIQDLRTQFGPELELIVLSNQPEKTADQYRLIGINRWSLLAILQSLRRADLLISGGGSLLQDVTSKKGILYYLGIIFAAQKLGKPVMIYSQGIGPITSPANRRLTARAINGCQGITVRDQRSKETLIEMGVTSEIKVSVDPVLGIGQGDVEDDFGAYLLAQKGVDVSGQAPVLLVSLRTWEKDAHLRSYAHAFDAMARQGWQIVFLPMQHPADTTLSEQVAHLMLEKSIVIDDSFDTPEMFSIIKQGDMLVGMRLHALIMAAAMEKPLVAISYDPKVEAFMGLLHLDEKISVAEMDESHFLSLLQRAWRERMTHHEERTSRLAMLRQMAKLPARIVGILTQNAKNA